MKQPSRFIVYVLLFCIVVVGGIARFYKLGEIPSGLTNDEANIGYDAYSVVKTGKDQWGQTLPFPSFKGFGDQRPALYTYMVAPSIYAFGLNAWSIRFPSALLGIAGIILTYLVTFELMKKRSVALFASLFVAINPWNIAMSRVSIESNASLPFFLFGLYFFLIFEKRWYFLLLSVLFFSVSAYMYTANIVFVPLFLLFLFIRERKIMAAPSRKKTSFFAIIFFIFCFVPLYITNASTASARASQVNITQDKGTLAVLDEKRGACQEVYPSGACKIIFNKPVIFLFKTFANYIEHFSPVFLSVSGTATQFSVLPPRGLLFLSEYFLFIIGIFYLITSKEKQKGILFGWLLLAPIADSVTGGGHYSRYFISEPVWQIIAAYGFYSLLQHKKVIIVAVMLGIAGCFEFFQGAVEYTTYFPTYYSRYSHFGYKELTQKLIQEKNTYDTIYLSSAVNDTKQYIFYLFYGMVDPQEFQSGSAVEKVEESNGWIRVRKIDNIFFVPTLPGTDDPIREQDKKILYIGAPSEFPKVYLPKQFEIRDKRGDVLFEGITLYDWKRCLEIDCREESK